ncbi:glycoside hydrolase family 18 protein [Melanogaster broomeanus]|nr:glycoside hydrolase family 18 protein [Melanogaster broomeanus]
MHDQGVGELGPPAVKDIEGYNVLMERPSRPLGAPPSTLLRGCRGIKLMVSPFGETDAPTSKGANPTTTADHLAEFVMKYDLDGVDVDYEAGLQEFAQLRCPMLTRARAEVWLATFTTALRAKLPAGRYIITHVPTYTSGAYLNVHHTVGSFIDRLPPPCTGLLTESSPTWPNTSVFQIAVTGVTLNKLVIGKPATTGDASNGYTSPSTLARRLKTAAEKKWGECQLGGCWCDGLGATWIKTVRSLAFPE